MISANITNPKAFGAEEKRKIVSIGLIQTTVSGDIAVNMEKTIEKNRRSFTKGAQIICLQELYRTKYFPQEEKQDVSNLAETIPGESTRAFSELAKKNKIVIIAPIFEKRLNGKYYNSAVTIDADGKILAPTARCTYQMTLCFMKKTILKQATQGTLCRKLSTHRVGVLICYDQWFPEPARINALKGAEIIFYPTAIGWIKGYTSSDGDWHDAWKTVQRANAIMNGVHVAAVNRVGEEGQLKFWGGSFVCDSFGKVLKEASDTEEEVLVVKVDLSKNKEIQEGWGFLKNRRPDTYNKLSEKNSGAQ